MNRIKISNNYIFKTRPHYVFICFSLIGAVVSVYLAYSIWSIKYVHGTDQKTGHVIVIIFSGFIILFSLICLYCVLRLEICYLTKDVLVLSRPLLFFEQNVLLADIKKITQKEDRIDVDQKSFKPDPVTVGHTASIWLKNGKQIKISSIEVWDYKELIKRIYIEMKTMQR